MKQTANKTLIGGFVVGAVSLLIAAIALFGSGTMFEDTEEYVLFFDHSISGLAVGSPVMFRGVPVGRVKAIRLSGDLDTMKFQTPVFIELTYGKRMDMVLPDTPNATEAQYLDQLVSHGFRASLATQSLVTGQLMIELNFYPKNQLPSVITKVSSYMGYLEIPTVPSTFDNIMEKATSLPVEQIAKNMLEISTDTRDLLNAVDLTAITQRMTKTLDALDLLLENTNTTVLAIQTMAKTYTAAVGNTEKRLDKTLDDASIFLQSATELAHEAKQTAASAHLLVNKNSTTVLELNQAIQEITRSAQALRALASMLERNPEALLRGK